MLSQETVLSDELSTLNQICGLLTIDTVVIVSCPDQGITAVWNVLGLP